MPQDDAVAAGLGADQGGIDAVETQQVADILNEELGRLLKMQPSEFWRAVTADNSIQVSLDSFLQFRRRWYDSSNIKIGKPLAGVIVGDQELLRRVFMVLYRMSLSIESGFQPTGTERRDVIHQKQIFDIPKLLDICAIYGHDNAKITRQLVNNAFAMNENLYDDLADIVPVISNTVHTMLQRCSSLTMQLPTKNSELSVVVKLQKELLEVLDFLNDAVTSLQAFIDAFPEGVVILVLTGKNSDSKDQIFYTLAAMHDSLIPTVHRSFSWLQKSYSERYLDSAAETCSSRLRFGLIELVWRLFQLSYLKENNRADSQNNVINYLLETYICDPRGRGEGLIKVLSGMLEEPNKSSTEDVTSSGGLIRNINRKKQLLERVNQLGKEGLIALDSAQYDYAEAVITQHSNAVVPFSMPDLAASPPSMQEPSEVDVWNESKISHIKDILPDYGSGFIAACLEAYDNNPEEVIQRILEDTLHLSLQSLDRTLEVKPSSLNTSVPAKAKGKGKVDEAPTQKSGSSSTQAVKPASLNTSVPVKDRGKGKVNAPTQKNGSSSTQAETRSSFDTSRWQGDANDLAQRRSSYMSTGSSGTKEDSRKEMSLSSDVELGVNSTQGRFVRKDKGEGKIELLLNERLPEDVLRTAAYAAQYEDEYDDSFDELGTSIADGVEETEILADLVRSKPPISGARGFYQGIKLSSVSRSDGIGRAANSSAPQNDWKGTSATESNNKFNDTYRKLQPPSSRGRGRGRRADPRSQFYVKDGMNYSYKVAGSTGVASTEDAEALKRVERETIHGLGQGGNVAISNDQASGLRYVKRDSLQTDSKSNHGELAGHGRGVQNRGRGFARKEHDHHHRKDRAMQKHFAGLGGM